MAPTGSAANTAPAAHGVCDESDGSGATVYVGSRASSRKETRIESADLGTGRADTGRTDIVDVLANRCTFAFSPTEPESRSATTYRCRPQKYEQGMCPPHWPRTQFPMP